MYISQKNKQVNKYMRENDILFFSFGVRLYVNKTKCYFSNEPEGNFKNVFISFKKAYKNYDYFKSLKNNDYIYYLDHLDKEIFGEIYIEVRIQYYNNDMIEIMTFCDDDFLFDIIKPKELNKIIPIGKRKIEHDKFINNLYLKNGGVSSAMLPMQRVRMKIKFLKSHIKTTTNFLERITKHTNLSLDEFYQQNKTKLGFSGMYERIQEIKKEIPKLWSIL